MPKFTVLDLKIVPPRGVPENAGHTPAQWCSQRFYMRGGGSKPYQSMIVPEAKSKLPFFIFFAQ